MSISDDPTIPENASVAVCPFCGTTDDLSMDNDGDAYFVRCTECRVMGPTPDSVGDENYDRFQRMQAIGLWNKRNKKLDV